MRSSTSMILLAFVLCLILESIRLPMMLEFFYPVWPVIFLFMLVTQAQSTYFWMWIWSLGLFLDVMQHHILGTHVISLSLLSLCLSRLLAKPERIHIGEFMIWIGVSSTVYLFVLSGIEGELHGGLQFLQILGQSLASALFWPWLKQFMRKPIRYQKKMI